MYALVAVCVLIAGFFLVRNLGDAIPVLLEQAAIRPELLLGAVFLMALAVLWYAFSWVLVLSQFQDNASFRWPLMRFFLLTWPVRYIPGTLPYYGVRVLMAERFGVTRRVVGASMIYELVLSVGSAAAMGVAGSTVGMGVTESLGGFYALTMVPLLALPLLLQPKFLVPLTNRALALARRPVLLDALLSGRQATISFLSYCLVHVFNGVAFFLVLSSLNASVSPITAVAVYSLAAAAGVLVIFVPSGIGVREAVVVALLGSTVSPETAVVAAGLTRAISVVADLVPLLPIGCFALVQKLRHGVFITPVIEGGTEPLGPKA